MSDIEPWHRRHAVSLAAQLPDDMDDALLILTLTINLVADFLHPKEKQRESEGNVIQLASVQGVCKA